MKQEIKQIIHAIASKNKNFHPIIQEVGENHLLDNKTILITGGGGGIGRAIAKSLIKSGGRVILVSRDEAKLREACNNLGNTNITYLAHDLSDVENLDSLIRKASKCFGTLDILVNSAGTHTENIDFWTVSPAEYDRVININLRGIYFLSRAFAKYLIEMGKNGHILNISSSTSNEPSWSPYRISKRALGGVTEGLAQLLLPYGIIVNGIAPGEVATSLINWHEGESIKTDHNKLNRMIMPEEVANLSLLLVSNLGDMIVGDTIFMSGGRGIIDIR